MPKVKTLEDVLADPTSFTSRVSKMNLRNPADDLREAQLTRMEREALDKSLRVSKRKPPKSNLKNIPARDQAQTPPYALLPLLPYIPKEWIIWESASSKWGFLGEAIRALRGNVVIETGLELDGTDYLKAPPKGDMQITNPPFSIKFEWIERSYDNRQPFALLMPFETWGAAAAQVMFQRFGMNVILFNRRVHFHMPNLGWGHYDEEGNPIMTKNARTGKMEHKKSRSDYPVAWFTWGLPHLKEPVTYGHIPLEKHLPQWMVRPNHKREITKGAKSMEDKLAIRQATNPTWPTPTKGG
jgi:hypothetical protein